MECVVIINASANSGRAPDWAQTLPDLFREHGLEATIRIAGSGEEISTEARRALDDRVPLIIAGGGDGTVNQVASVLADGQCCLGVLPLGTLNHFAKDLGMPMDLDKAIAALGAGRERQVDAAEVNGKLFLNNSGIGLYPLLVRDREARQDHNGSSKWAAFMAAFVAVLRRFPMLQVDVKADGAKVARRTPFVFVGNNRYCMDGLDIGSRERLDGGELSLYLGRKLGRWGMLRLAIAALFGRAENADELEILHTDTLSIATRQSSVEVSTDGEVCTMQSPLNYRIRPACLRVRVPSNAMPAAA
jgi:YegS/Rv2252/BmrU family lipid kinase